MNPTGKRRGRGECNNEGKIEQKDEKTPPGREKKALEVGSFSTRGEEKMKVKPASYIKSIKLREKKKGKG